MAAATGSLLSLSVVHLPPTSSKIELKIFIIHHSVYSQLFYVLLIIHYTHNFIMILSFYPVFRQPTTKSHIGIEINSEKAFTQCPGIIFILAYFQEEKVICNLIIVRKKE